MLYGYKCTKFICIIFYSRATVDNQNQLHVVSDGTVQAFLKVSKLANKGQFERYSIRYLPKFISVNELKQYLLGNYSEELSPASNCTSLTIGYMSDGRRKCDIKTEKQLDDAYRSVKNGWITLWVNPHSSFKRKQGEIERREAGKAKRKRNSGMNGVMS